MRKWRQKLRQIATNSGWKKGRMVKQIWTKIRKMTTRGRTMYFPITKGFPSANRKQFLIRKKRSAKHVS